MNALSTVKKGQIHTVVALKPKTEQTLIKLMALGIMPGCQVKVEQQFPSYIISMGRTRAALDRETAEEIWVERV
ncbi:ferrous iron transport protein A [Spirulina subsalsa FACHB-351]|uniref:Ferrous iron transport protein A n=1 Tax=Spirulina subsalsa FACHB-351 TaxID=234711 RepID=A0ABT3L1I9_9CYAN|nr:FeoA family protein [Spirulina subsalsa]MCW6035366.1 ferrous iron transport protein A [Spirulina subsalsa FACHB-351]